MTFSTEKSSLPALSHADALAANTADFLLLFGRVLLGCIFIRSGYGKIFDIGTYSMTFAARGLPAYLAHVSVPLEFFGGIALLIGLVTRFFAAAFVIEMMVISFAVL